MPPMAIVSTTNLLLKTTQQLSTQGAQLELKIIIILTGITMPTITITITITIQ